MDLERSFAGRLGRAATAVWRALALAVGAVGAIGVGTLFCFGALCVIGAAFFGAGCAFTQKVVDRAWLKTPETRFDDLDPGRDLQDIAGLAGGEGGGGGGGGC